MRAITKELAIEKKAMNQCTKLIQKFKQKSSELSQYWKVVKYQNYFPIQCATYRCRAIKARAEHESFDPSQYKSEEFYTKAMSPEKLNNVTQERNYDNNRTSKHSQIGQILYIT